MIRNILIAAIVACAWGAADRADAQWGMQNYPTWYARNVYSVYDQDRLPYFALHPPVYYSRPVPRTYGYSPFAYPEYVMTPEIATAEPEVIVNPYYDSAPTAPDAAAPQGAMPAPKVSPPIRQPSAPLKKTPAAAKSNRSASVSPLRITNPHAARFVSR